MAWIASLASSQSQQGAGQTQQMNSNGQGSEGSGNVGQIVSAVQGAMASKGNSSNSTSPEMKNNMNTLNGTMDNHFYGHMTVPSARSGHDINITGAGDVFNKTKEDKAFAHASNLSSKKGDCRKAK